MKQLSMQQRECVYGGRYSCSADDRSDCSGEREGPRGASESYFNREQYSSIGGDIGSVALGFVGGAICGDGCSAVGSAVGARLGSFYGGLLYDKPEAFKHPEYPEYTWPHQGKRDD